MPLPKSFIPDSPGGMPSSFVPDTAAPATNEMTVPTAPKEQSTFDWLLGGAGDIAKAVVSPVANMIARPGQMVQHLMGDTQPIEGKFLGMDITDPYADAGRIEEAGGSTWDALKANTTKDIGRGIQTVALGLGPTSALRATGIGAVSGFGHSLEQGNSPLSLETAAETGIGGAGGALGYGAIKLTGAALRGVSNVLSELGVMNPSKGVTPNLANMIAGDDSTDLAMRALKPYKTISAEVKAALPTALELAGKTGVDVQDLPSFSTGLDKAREGMWNAIMQRVGHGESAILEGKPIGDAIRSVVKENPKLFFENPALAQDVEKFARLYENAGLDVPGAEKMLEQANAFLKAIYEKHPSVGQVNNLGLQQQMNLKLAEALRGGIDDTLTKVGSLPYSETLGPGAGEGVGDLKKLYGALAKVTRAVNDRIPVNDRLAKFNLAEQLNIPSGMGDVIGAFGNGKPMEALGGITKMFTGNALKTANSSDFQIARAVDLAKGTPLSGGVIPSFLRGASNLFEKAGNAVSGIPGAIKGAQDFVGKATSMGSGGQGGSAALSTMAGGAALGTGALGIEQLFTNPRFGSSQTYTRPPEADSKVPGIKAAVAAGAPAEYASAVARASEHTGLSVQQLVSHFESENGGKWDPNLRGRADPTDRGITQLNPSAVATITGQGGTTNFFKNNFGHDFNAANGEDQILGAATYLNWLRQFGLPGYGLKNPTDKDVFTAYNTGAKGYVQSLGKNAPKARVERARSYQSLLSRTGVEF